MGWANVSIGSEINRIETAASGIENKDSKTADALHAIASALKKIEVAMDTLAYNVRGK